MNRSDPAPRGVKPLPRRLAMVVLFAVVCCSVAGTVVEAEENCTGVWKTRHLFVTAEAEVEQEGTSLRGVAYVQRLNGKIDVYHFTGTVQGGELQACHTDGHSFRGRFEGSEEISGILTTKTGLRLEIRAERYKPVLAGEGAAGDDKSPCRHPLR